MSQCIECNEQFEPDHYWVHCNECGDKVYEEMWGSVGDIDESEVVWI